MEKHLFNLKFAAKQLNRDSKKAEKEEKAERAKLKKAMEKGNMEVARIHAENGKIIRTKYCFGHSFCYPHFSSCSIKLRTEEPFTYLKIFSRNSTFEIS